MHVLLRLETFWIKLELPDCRLSFEGDKTRQQTPCGLPVSFPMQCPVAMPTRLAEASYGIPRGRFHCVDGLLQARLNISNSGAVSTVQLSGANDWKSYVVNVLPKPSPSPPLIHSSTLPCLLL